MNNFEENQLHGQTFKRFFLSSLLGLIVDLLAFQILVFVNVSLGLANLISSSLAVLLLYFLVSRYTFAKRGTFAAALVFYLWYFTVIIIFSLLIEVVTSVTFFSPIEVKVFTVPCSFFLNYLFSRFVFKRLLK